MPLQPTSTQLLMRVVATNSVAPGGALTIPGLTDILRGADLLFAEVQRDADSHDSWFERPGEVRFGLQLRAAGQGSLELLFDVIAIGQTALDGAIAVADQPAIKALARFMGIAGGAASVVTGTTALIRFLREHQATEAGDLPPPPAISPRAQEALELLANAMQDRRFVEFITERECWQLRGATARQTLRLAEGRKRPPRRPPAPKTLEANRDSQLSLLEEFRDLISREVPTGEPDDRRFANILDLAFTLGVRQADLAAALGMSQATVSRWARRRSMPKGASRQAILRILANLVEDLIHTQALRDSLGPLRP